MEPPPVSQHSNALKPLQRYTRTDFTALRAYLSRMPAAVILDRYFSEEDAERLGLDGPIELTRYLVALRDDMIDRLTETQPHLAAAIAGARDRGVWSKLAIDYLVQAADQSTIQPQPADTVGQWFLPVLAQRLRGAHIATLGQLVQTLRIRGIGWYRTIPALGEKKAAVIVQWLRDHAATLGELPERLASEEIGSGSDVVVLEAFSSQLVPLSRMAIAHHLDGSQGINRNTIFPLVSAQNDLQAVQAFLTLHRNSDKTYRAYKKELERFLLWCVCERGIALSSALVEDCGAYIEFLGAPKAHWIGPRCPRSSREWRPFAKALAPSAQRYAVIVIESFFAWLQDMRYLAGNPWRGVRKPKPIKRLKAIQIDKALPSSLWEKLSLPGGILDQLCDHTEEQLRERFVMKGFGQRYPILAQVRLFRVALLLLGETGMRREELAHATRDNLTPSNLQPGIWRLMVLGKGRKERFVLLTDRVAQALQAHWQDRGEDFSYGMTNLPLVSPIVIPPTLLSQTKHQDRNDGGSRGFSPDGIYSMVTAWMTRLGNDERCDLSDQERHALRQAGVHSLRHTFGRMSARDQMDLDVLQKLMGHASLSTTTIYVDSEEQRASKIYGQIMAERMKG